MANQTEEQLLDAVVYSGSVIRCSVEPLGSNPFVGAGFNQVTVEIGRRDEAGEHFRLSITTSMQTDGLTLQQIQGYALGHAQKLIEHTVRNTGKVEAQ